MSRLAAFTTHDGATFVAEVDDPADARDPSRVMRGGGARTELIAESSQALEAALGGVKQAAEAMFQRLSTLATPPDETTVEFGVKLSAETGAVIAKAATEANFTVTLKWKRAPARGE